MIGFLITTMEYVIDFPELVPRRHCFTQTELRTHQLQSPLSRFFKDYRLKCYGPREVFYIAEIFDLQNWLLSPLQIMFIIIIGTRASGKSAVKEYLVRYKDFRNVRLLDAAKAAESVK